MASKGDIHLEEASGLTARPQPGQGVAATLDTSGRVVRSQTRGRGLEYIYWPDLSPFTQGYVEALLSGPVLATTAQLVVRGQERDFARFAFSDLAPETLARIMEDCERFEASEAWQTFNDALEGNLNEEGAERAAGQALWLTRNRYDHAIVAGFWSDEWGVFGEDLAEAACELKPLTPYLGDDGKVYLRDSAQ